MVYDGLMLSWNSTVRPSAGSCSPGMPLNIIYITFKPSHLKSEILRK